MRLFFLLISLFFSLENFAQSDHEVAARKWADSVYQSLNKKERIAQLVVARLSTYDGKTKTTKSFFDQVLDLVKNYNIGGVCIFQGGPVEQALQLNQLKAAAKTPILFSIDAEWGLGMRLLDSIIPLPKQMMLGAMRDSSIVYEYGKLVAEQCKRMGIQMNYAPDVDVNNNPNNPVINDRSFGEDKNKVAEYGIQYMRGMQDNGVLACAKHFPGHGDVNVDSHLDLPEIRKSLTSLEANELYPFRKIFQAGVGSVMIGHLSIPSIDDRPHRPTSLSQKNIQGLLRKEIGFQGLTITDGLEMQGVKKFFQNGQASVEAIVAGSDLLCIPDSIPMVLDALEKAIREGRIKEQEIEFHCKRVLMAKFKYVANQNQPIEITNLSEDLNRAVPAMRKKVAEHAITLLRNEDDAFLPFQPNLKKEKIAFVGLGLPKGKTNKLSDLMKNEFAADCYLVDTSMKNKDNLNALLDEIITNHHKIVLGIHNLSRTSANNFGLTKEMVWFANMLQQRGRTITIQFGNAYAARNWCFAKNLVICYEDDPIVQTTAFEMLTGKLIYKGVLPVTVCEQFPYGSGLQSKIIRSFR